MALATLGLVLGFLRKGFTVQASRKWNSVVGDCYPRHAGRPLIFRPAGTSKPAAPSVAPAKERRGP